jgi:Protein of unknown function (DUF4235)
MSNVLFIPVSIVGGILAGLLAKKAFERLWGIVDEEEAPDPKHREVAWGKLIPALLVEGAIFRAVRGVLDHAMRRLFSRATGRWPGEERPESA